MPQKFPNLPLGYMCDLIVWNYKINEPFWEAGEFYKDKV